MHLLLVDDDPMSRDLISMLLQMEGHAVTTAEDGEAALAALRSGQSRPAVVLTDMQMPGITGRALAAELRKLAGPEVLIFGMSATQPAKLDGFDGFLLKPFDGAQFTSALEKVKAGGDVPSSASQSATTASSLSEDIFAKLSSSMPPAALRQLFEVCFGDARQRIERMKDALSANDDALFRKEAHAIKGSCAMLGATGLADLASTMEASGIGDDSGASLQEFLLACKRLEDILLTRLRAEDGSTVV